jgi:hypothetical protein
MRWPWQPKKHDTVEDRASDDLPVWMHPIELSQVLAIVHSVGPRCFLEWGAGGSTRLLLERCSHIERYVAIEHDESWGLKVRARVTDPRLDLRLVPPDKPLALASPTPDQEIEWHAQGERDETIFANYVRAAGNEAIYDAILVDGRARRFCIRRGFELLKPGGVLFVHDAQRVEYHDALHAVGDPVFLEPWSQGQVALVRKHDG